MAGGGPRPTDADLRRYLEARAEAAAEAAAGLDMAERVAMEVGLVEPRNAGRTRALRLAVVGAAIAALLAIGFGSGVLPPKPAPTQSPQPSERPSPAPLTSPSALVALPSVAFADTGTIAVTADAVWVADRATTLAELDPSTGATLRTVQLPRVASKLLLTDDSVWVSSTAGDLVRVDWASLAVTAIPGAVGVALSAGPTGIWLGGTDEIVRVDPATNQVALRVIVANRSAELGVAAIADAIWVATRAEILRLNGTDGTTTGRIAGDASRLVVSGGYLWATRGTELLQIDPTAAAVLVFIPGLPTGAELVASGDRVWAAGPTAGGPVGQVVGVSAATGLRDILTDTVSVRDLAAGAGGIWVISDTDTDGGTIYRFAVP